MIEDKFISTASTVESKEEEVYLVSSYFDMENFVRTYTAMYECPDLKSVSGRYKLEPRVQTESLYQNSDIDLIKESLRNRELNTVQSDLFIHYAKKGDENVLEIPLTRWQSFLNRTFKIEPKNYVDPENVDFYIAKLSNKIINDAFNRPNFIVVDNVVLEMIKKNPLFVFADKTNLEKGHITFEGTLNGFRIFAFTYMKIWSFMLMGCSNSFYFIKGEETFEITNKDLSLTTNSKIVDINPYSKFQFSGIVLNSSKKPLWKKILKL